MLPFNKGMPDDVWLKIGPLGQFFGGVHKPDTFRRAADSGKIDARRDQNGNREFSLKSTMAWAAEIQKAANKNTEVARAKMRAAQGVNRKRQIAETEAEHARLTRNEKQKRHTERKP